MLPAHIHLVGIGGAGMASLAQYLLAAGRIVSGSDRARTPAIEALRRQGARIAHEHSEALLEGAQMVVASDAIPAGNVELEGARRRGIAVLRRAECLDLLREGRTSVMVAGSHGKSSTSAMISCILREAGLNPGFAIGADVPSLDGLRAHPGGPDFFVAEACEAFRNLDALTPQIAVITHVDDEHVNHYPSQAALDAAFFAFAGRARQVVASGEDPGVGRLALGEALPASITLTRFGLDARCEVWAAAEPAPFEPVLHGQSIGLIQLQQPGDHMRRNALAALAACQLLGVSAEAMRAGLQRFSGVDRRWQEQPLVAGVRIVDDFAHHPAELAATLRTARQVAPERRLVAAFQPLLHSRVQRMQEAFADSLALADQVLLLEVDGGGETTHSAGSAAIAAGLRARGVAVQLRADAQELIAHIHEDLQAGDLLLVMGGGGMAGVAARVHDHLQQHPPGQAAAREPAKLAHPSSPAASRPPAPLRTGPSMAAPQLRAQPTPQALRPPHWRHRVAQVWRRPDSFVTQFRAAARAHGAQPALLGRDGRMSYAELGRASDELAAGLASLGLAGATIGVALPLGAELIVALLGILKAGASYVPLDLSQPEARRDYMLEQAGACAVLGQAAGHADAGAEARPWRHLQLGPVRLLGGRVPPAPPGSARAYVCFTSGSTGFPKGIGIAHAQLAALLRDTASRFGLGPGSRMLLNTSSSFDVSMAEICNTLAAGAALVIAGQRPLAGQALSDALRTQEVTHLCITPSLLASAPPEPLPQLRCIIAAGEACPPELVAQWAPGRQFFNAYGPTEATVYATVARCEAGQPVRIGQALAHVQAHVLNESLQPVATGEMGELCLSGLGVAAGYLGLEEETARRFVTTRIGARECRLYRTGDMVRQDADGQLHYIGRADSQVKINGVRIELDEIERVVLAQPGVAHAAVCLAKDPRPALLCFVQAACDAAPDFGAIAGRLSAWLPESAIPSRIQLVPAIPLTPSGKKDRQRLIKEHGSRSIVRAAEYWLPRTPIEAQLAKLWAEALGLAEPVGMLDRFPDLGGDSLAALILIQGIEAHFKVEVPPGYFGRIGALPQMATQLDELLWHQGGEAQAQTGFLGSRVYRRMRDLCGHWPGTRRTPDSLISTLGPPEAPLDLFLCCQNEDEFKSLAARLAPRYRVHAMRSGHLVIDNGPGGIAQLAARYAEEISAIDPRGPLLLAGVCQGGAIARGISERLASEGRPTALLVLIEPGRPLPYGGRVALIAAEDSFLNPLRPGGPGLASFEQAYPAGLSLDLIPGLHGNACVEPAVEFLAHHLARRVDAALASPTAAAAAA